MSVLKIKNNSYNIRISNIDFIEPIISSNKEEKEIFSVEFYYDFHEFATHMHYKEKTTKTLKNIFDCRGEVVKVKYDEGDNIFCSEENRKKRFEINGKLICSTCYKDDSRLAWLIKVNIKKIKNVKKDGNKKITRNFYKMNLNI